MSDWSKVINGKKEKITIIIIIIIIINNNTTTTIIIVIIIIIIIIINELGKRITAVTQEPRETQYLFQRMSVALQRGNAVAFQNTFPAERSINFFTKGQAIP